jgi:uncharacterized lipoprotein YmbA
MNTPRNNAIPEDKDLSRLSRRMLPLLAAALFAGCASKSTPPRIYVFSPAEARAAALERSEQDSDFTVRLAGVTVSPYLNRPQIVSRRSDTEIFADPDHRWGMPIEDTIAEILRETLALELPGAFVDTQTARSSRNPGYSVLVTIVRMDGKPGESVELIANWSLTRGGETGGVITRKFSRFEEKTADGSKESYLKALRSLLVSFGTEIADTIASERSVPGE